MTDLPRAPKVSVLTDGNNEAVVKAYLNQLVRGTCRDHEAATKFITKAIKYAHLGREAARNRADLLYAQQAEILRFVPHIITEKRLDNTEVAKWAQSHEIEYHCYTDETELEYVWIFKTVEDSILFKLKWV